MFIPNIINIKQLLATPLPRLNYKYFVPSETKAQAQVIKLPEKILRWDLNFNRKEEYFDKYRYKEYYEIILEKSVKILSERSVKSTFYEVLNKVFNDSIYYKTDFEFTEDFEIPKGYEESEFEPNLVFWNFKQEKPMILFETKSEFTFDFKLKKADDFILHIKELHYIPEKKQILDKLLIGTQQMYKNICKYKCGLGVITNIDNSYFIKYDDIAKCLYISNVIEKNKILETLFLLTESCVNNK